MSKILIEKFDEIWERAMGCAERSSSWKSSWNIERSKEISRLFVEKFEHADKLITVMLAPISLVYTCENGEVFHGSFTEVSAKLEEVKLAQADTSED